MGKKQVVPDGISVQELFQGSESQVTISGGSGKNAEASIEIHPWTRENPAVYVAVGYFNKKGRWQRAKKGSQPDEWMQNAIFNREDFVEAILAVFPELERAK